MLGSHGPKAASGLLVLCDRGMNPLVSFTTGLVKPIDLIDELSSSKGGFFVTRLRGLYGLRLFPR